MSREIEQRMDTNSAAELAKDLEKSAKLDFDALDLLSKALAQGSIKEVVGRVNEQLVKDGSDLRIVDSEHIEKMKYEALDTGRYLPPMITDNPRADVSVTKASTGETVDGAKFGVDPVYRGYSKPESVSQ